VWSSITSSGYLSNRSRHWISCALFRGYRLRRTQASSINAIRETYPGDSGVRVCRNFLTLLDCSGRSSVSILRQSRRLDGWRPFKGACVEALHAGCVPPPAP
jgi:hypothetical protein